MSRNFIIGIVSGALLLLINDLFFFESIVVTSSSMEPTLLANERVFLKKFSLPDLLPRFSVVVFASRTIQEASGSSRVVKRIVAMPGECVELLENHIVRVNGKILEETAHPMQLQENPKIHFETLYGKPGTPYCLKDGEYYALGDNRLASGDSRFYGPFRREEAQGVLTKIWYSFDLKHGGIRTDRLGKTIP